MNRISSTYLKLTTLLLLVFFQVTPGKAQSPEIPASILFGGITVKFDRTAQNLIEEDIKSLMSNRKFWEEKMDRAILYFPIVESILMDEEVPIDFKYLAVQESSFKPDVVSSSNAVGFWQFKPETAMELNLRVDKNVDERKNISSSTHAAAWYLKKNNQQLNNWVSALYSYYQGVGGVKKLVPANWAYAREVVLNGKTDRYMLRFFAHKIALEAGLERYRTSLNLVLIESEYGKGKSFSDISRELGISENDLKNYNRWVSDNRVPTDKEYLLTIPVPTNQVASVRSKLSLPPQSQNQTAIATAAANTFVPDETGFPVLKKSSNQGDKNGYVLYDINGLPGIEARSGDDDKSIASAGNLRKSRFRKYNDLTVDIPVVPGNIYYLARKNKKAATPFHTAKVGDSWHSISQQYGIRLVNLLKYNRTISRNYPVQVGQVVWLNKKRPRNQPIEIITPKPEDNKVTNPVIASAPAQTPKAGANDIPANAAGRKKYTPVLVDKSQSSIAKENQPFEPGVTPTVSTPAANVEIPVAVAKPSTANTNDRVVIITQDNNDGSFKPTEEPKAQTAKPAAKPVQKPAPRRSADADLFSTPSENASRIPANTQPAAFDNPLPPVKEKPAVVSARESNVFHTVEAGQTFYSISRLHNLSVKELLALNKLNDIVTLSVGQKLIVKKETTAPVESKSSLASEKSSKGSGTKTHTVAPGETLFRISQNYQVGIDEIQKLNNLSGNTVKVGQKLKIPQQ